MRFKMKQVVFALIPGQYDKERTPVIYVKDMNFPSFGAHPDNCPHPSKYHLYAEWDSKSLGHGWFCALCGKLMQVG